MLTEVVELTDLLKKIASDITFRPDDGAFRTKLATTAIADADEEFTEHFSADSSDIVVSISGHTFEEGILLFQVISDQGEQSLQCDLEELNTEERSDLAVQLSRLAAEQESPGSQGPAKTFIRRKMAAGMLTINQAAQGIGCSESFLKSKIPCTDYTYDEIDGKKIIREYFWSPQLIERLAQIKLNGVKTDDVKQIAEECCYGDCKWAEEILVSLARPKPAVKVGGTIPNGMTKQPAKVVSKGQVHNRHPRKKNP